MDEDKRIMFAVMAMQGLVSQIDTYTYEEIARCAVLQADALIKELEKPRDSDE